MSGKESLSFAEIIQRFIYKGFSDYIRSTRMLTRYFWDNFSLNQWKLLFIRVSAIFADAPQSAHKALFGSGWYQWLGRAEREGLKAEFEGLNFSEIIK